MKFGSNYQALAHHYMHNDDYSECYGNRMFSEGKKLYSYGRHYLMALRGSNWIIINDRGYSVTTSKQERIVRAAVPHGWQVWHFDPAMHLRFTKIFEEYFGRIKQLVAKAKKARTKTADYIYDANCELQEFQRYFEFFKAKFDLRRITKVQKQVLEATDVQDIDVMDITKAQSAAARRERRRVERRREIQRQKGIEREREQVAKWQAHEIPKVYLYHSGLTFLRVTNSVESTRVETTQGLEFDVDQCRKLYKLLMSDRIAAQGRIVTLGNMNRQIKEWSDKRLIIGCHVIPRSEVERVALELNF